MSDGRCSSACEIDGDWLRDTLSSSGPWMQRAPNDPVAGEPGARHGACRSKMASSAARHGKRRDGERRVARSERSERSRQAACLALARIRLSRSELSRPVTDRTRRGPRAQPRSKSVC